MKYKREKDETACGVYRNLIIEMVETVDDEKFLRSIYIILKTHINRDC